MLPSELNYLVHAVVVLPTFNEKDNIGLLLEGILHHTDQLDGVRVSVLVVDDASPDGTGDVVKAYARRYANINLLRGVRQGLGAAYIRGYKHAMVELGADILIGMDADLSHDPADIPRLLAVSMNECDVVIGSRYVPNGSIPRNWSWIRKANSKYGNICARYIAGLRTIKDCTSGYRAIRACTLREIDLDRMGVQGYAFIMRVLHEAVKNGATVAEVPIAFTDRVNGTSKLGLPDVMEFIATCMVLRFPRMKSIVPIRALQRR